MKNLAICVLLLFTVSCNSDTKSESYYFLPEDEAIDVGYPYGSMVYKGLQKYSFSNVVITSDVLKFKQNSNFVVFNQQINNELLKKWISDGIKSFIASKGYNGERKELIFYDYVLVDTLLLKYDSSDSSINYLASIVLESPLIQKMKQNSVNYWIVPKLTDSLIGPLTKLEFEVAYKKLQIPDKLKLD